MSGTFLAAPYQQRALLAVVVLGVVAAVVGVHVVLRRLSFVADAMSHTVLPGVVLANLAGVSLYAGALVAGLVTALLLGLPARARRIGEDAAVAILLTGFFAVGVAVVSRGRSFATDLTGFLFGSLLTVRADDLVLMTAIGGAAVVAITLFHKELVLRAFDRAAAEAVGLPVARLDLLLDVAVAVVIVTALRAVGTLLAVAFVITPAATARRLGLAVVPSMVVAAVLAAVCGVAGLALSHEVGLRADVRIAPGATVVVLLSTVFVAVTVAMWWRTRVRAT